MTNEIFASPEDLNTAFLVDQYGTYERLHEIGPIHKSKTLDGGPAWFVTGYAGWFDVAPTPTARTTLSRRRHR
jgi:hypothetical protein